MSLLKQGNVFFMSLTNPTSHQALFSMMSYVHTDLPCFCLIWFCIVCFSVCVPFSALPSERNFATLQNISVDFTVK